MKHLTPLFISLALFLGTGCQAVVGDACEINTDCGTKMYCERSMPEGYCTITSCEVIGCPDFGVCVAFDLDTSFCMDPCEAATDCREGYTCVTDFGPHPFCNDAAAP
jgi:hypothetical protein